MISILISNCLTFLCNKNHFNSLTVLRDEVTLWHGIVSGATPGMAAKNTFEAQPCAFEDTVFEYRFHHILAARRRIAAGWRCKGRDEDPIEIDGEKENFSGESFPFVIGYL